MEIVIIKVLISKIVDKNNATAFVAFLEEIVFTKFRDYKYLLICCLLI